MFGIPLFALLDYLIKKGFDFENEKDSFDDFLVSFYGYEDYTITKIIIIILKVIFFILSPAILILVFFLFPFWLLCAKIDKLNGIMLTSLLKNLGKIRKVDSFVFLFSMESVSNINEFSSSVYI